MKIDIESLEASLEKVEKEIAGWKHPICPRCKGPLMMKTERVLQCSNCNSLCQLIPVGIAKGE